jgi:protein SCO1/2
MNDWTRVASVARREPRLDSVARVNPGVRVLGWILVSAACVLLCASKARAEVSAEADPHAHHHHMMQTPPPMTRSTANYSVPDITLVRADGAHVKLAQELDDGRPVLLDFIYTTCTTICPVMSQTFAEVQKRLGAQAAKIKMMSVSIDPEEDTPARLIEYAKRYQAGPQWSFYTGTAQASIEAQRVFNVYRGDKMNHAPAALFRSAPGQPWVRLDGFATPDALLSEIHTQLAQK